MKKILKAALVCIFISATTVYSPAQDKIVIAGTGDSQELLRVLASVFEKSRPGIKIEVPDSIGSSGGIKAVQEGKCTIARSARMLKDKEKAAGLNEKIFAYSPLVFLINPSVKGIENLSHEQIVNIFSGKSKLWSELGAEGKKIYAAQREVGDSSRSLLEKNISGWLQIEDPAGQVLYSTPELVSTVAKYDYTIGYAPLSMAIGKGLIITKLAGIAPNAENIKNNNYPVLIPFVFIWKGELGGLAKDFVDFVLSPEAEKLIIDHGAVPASMVNK